MVNQDVNIQCILAEIVGEKYFFYIKKNIISQ
jgi:hypothetical protein